MKKYIHLFYICFFLLILIIPLSMTNTQIDVTSEIDNRKLKEMPVFGEKGFTSNFESYLTDRLGARNFMIREYAVLNDIIARELAHPLYTYGQNGYIFFKMHNNISYGDFHKSFAEMTKKLQTYCESRGAKFYFIFDPEKNLYIGGTSLSAFNMMIHGSLKCLRIWTNSVSII